MNTREGTEEMKGPLGGWVGQTAKVILWGTEGWGRIAEGEK